MAYPGCKEASSPRKQGALVVLRIIEEVDYDPEIPSIRELAISYVYFSVLNV